MNALIHAVGLGTSHDSRLFHEGLRGLRTDSFIPYVFTDCLPCANHKAIPAFSLQDIWKWATLLPQGDTEVLKGALSAQSSAYIFLKF